MKPMKLLEEFRGGDGAHCGLSDWYPAKEAALLAALKAKQPFDTGWYSSKKEIATARIISDGRTVNVEVSVSDDFDTPGTGHDSAKPTIEDIREAISRAWEKAEANQRDNRCYKGYKVLHWSITIPKWLRGEGIYPKETRKRYHEKQAHWEETYIADTAGMDAPTGDYYHFWGWQSDRNEKGDKPDKAMKIPDDVVQKFTKFANSLKRGSLRIGDWEIKEWTDELETD